MSTTEIILLCILAAAFHGAMMLWSINKNLMYFIELFEKANKPTDEP